MSYRGVVDFFFVIKYCAVEVCTSQPSDLIYPRRNRIRERSTIWSKGLNKKTRVIAIAGIDKINILF